MQAVNNAAGLVAQALAALGNNALGVDQANTAFHASLEAVNKSLATNGTTIDENTVAGQANHTVIDASIAAARTHMAAIAQQTGSTEQGTAAYYNDIEALKGHYSSTTASGKAIQAMIDTMAKI